VQRLADTALGTPIDPEGDTMKSLIAAIIGFTIVTAAGPGTAYVVEVVTSIPVPNSVDDTKQLEGALEAAIKDVVEHVIAFTPTIIMLEKVRVVGERIYLLLLFADADGEKTMAAFSSLQPTPTDPRRLYHHEAPRRQRQPHSLGPE
jgi:hypothetical protein